jgi:hypothetical protein
MLPKIISCTELLTGKSANTYTPKEWLVVARLYAIATHSPQAPSLLQLNASFESAIKKTAVSVVIAPFEPLIQKAIELVDSVSPGYFSGIKEVRVEASLEAGEPFHYGKVREGEDGIIYISMNAVRGAAGGSEAETVRAIAIILAHEMGHLKAHMSGGEGPAETEEKRVADLIDAKKASYTQELIAFADHCDALGYGHIAIQVENSLLS